MSNPDVLTVGGQQIVRETLRAKRGVRPAMTITRPLRDTGERPRLACPGICETKEAFDEMGILSALGGVAFVAFDQPRVWCPITLNGVRELRVSSAVNAINTTNDLFDGRGVIAQPHSLAGVDMAYAEGELTSKAVPEVIFMAPAGLRKNTALSLWMNTRVGVVNEARHMGVDKSVRVTARLTKGSLQQLGAEGWYGTLASTEQQVRALGAKGIKVTVMWFGNDRLIPPSSNREVEGLNVRTMTVEDPLGRACHSMTTCAPEPLLEHLTNLAKSNAEQGAPIASIEQFKTTSRNGVNGTTLVSQQTA